MSRNKRSRLPAEIKDDYKQKLNDLWLVAYLWMRLTFNLLLGIFITSVFSSVLGFNRVIFGYFETLMCFHAVVANVFLAINAPARR